MTELAVRDDVLYSARALELVDIDFTRYCEIGATLGRIRGAVQWWIGDFLVHGERVFGEAYAQAADATGLDAETLRGYQWMAEKIPPVRRRTSLSWSAHREVAALPPAEADGWLDRAEREGLRSRDLRRLIREERTGDVEATLTLRVPRATLDQWEERAGIRPLPEAATEVLNAWASDA